LFACSDGFEEAKVFEYKGIDIKWHTSIHGFFTVQRVVVWSSLASVMCIFKLNGSLPMLAAISLFALGCVAIFPFFHDGMYYTTRKFLDLPNLNWFSQSKSTNAKFSFGGKVRTVFAIIGFAVILYIDAPVRHFRQLGESLISLF